MKRAPPGPASSCSAALAAGSTGMSSPAGDGHRQLIDRGDAALATDDMLAAIESFSGAIALQERLDARVSEARRGLSAPPPARGRAPGSAAGRRLDPLAPRPLELLGDVNYARAPLSARRPSTTRPTSSSTIAPRACSTSWRWRTTAPASRRRPSRRSRRPSPSTSSFAEAHYLLGLCFRDAQRSARALASLQKAVALAPAVLPARARSSPISTGASDAPTSASTQLEALLALDPGPGAGGRARPRVRARRPVRSRGDDAAARRRALSDTRTPTSRSDGSGSRRRRRAADRVDLSKALGALEKAVGRTTAARR